jgi:hypothetical protein
LVAVDDAFLAGELVEVGVVPVNRVDTLPTVIVPVTTALVPVTRPE